MTSDPLFCNPRDTQGLSYSEIREKVASGQIQSAGPFKIYNNTKCHYCHASFTPETWTDCPKCHSGPYYCSDACVVNDSPNHKKDCYWRRQFSIPEFRKEYKNNQGLVRSFNKDIQKWIPRKHRKATSVVMVRFNYDTVNVVPIHQITSSIRKANIMMLTEEIIPHLYLPSRDCDLPKTVFCDECKVEHPLQQKCVAYFRENVYLSVEDAEIRNFVLVDLEEDLDHLVPITQEQADNGDFIRIL